MPESLHPVTIDFSTGYVPAPNCSPQPVTVYVPLSFTPPEAPSGCTAFGPAGAAAAPAAKPSLLDKAGKWLQQITH